MSEVSLTKQIPWYRDFIRILLECIYSFIDSFSKEMAITLIMPTNIVKRTQLICNYISEELHSEFGIYDLIMLLYENFIRNATKKYEPMKMFRELNRTYNYDDVIKISYSDKEVYSFNRVECDRKQVVITMSKEVASKGQLLLDELYDLYGHNLNIDKMIYKIWVNFIEDYKRGEENQVLRDIIKMLKNVQKGK
jgi:hypothetical protein